MAKNDIKDFDSTAANNTDINSVDIAEGCAPSGINNAIRELMADLKNAVFGKLNVTSDTSAGDNAAIGYTATEGLILTGQGSTSDVTIKNDDDADVITIPTGTTKAIVSGILNVNVTALNEVASFKCTDHGAATAAVQFIRGGATAGVAGDPCIDLMFYHNDDAGAANSYGRIRVDISDPAAGAEDGRMEFFTSIAGAETIFLSSDNGDVSIPAGDLTVKDLLKTTEVSIDDDAAAAITPPRKGGFFFITFGGDTTTPGNSSSGLVFYDVGNSLTGSLCIPLFSTNMTIAAAARTGTDGTDGKLNIGIQTNSVQIENRAGATKNMQIVFL